MGECRWSAPYGDLVQRLDWLDGSVKLGGLVLDVEGNLLELVLMHVCVVSAEQ